MSDFQELLDKEIKRLDDVLSKALLKYFDSFQLLGNYHLLNKVAEEMLRITYKFPKLKDENAANKAALIVKIKWQKDINKLFDKFDRDEI